ncbi:helix-turn-helix domain-containing protein [Reichenbachiella ulvae]|uniref:AraC family transcriptional regulator n=1 Tax=Reichenbachiella ulvae TaxID=2980104 RepID=A0ABT3CVS0_9BACT|nr:helix-turn-helix domain-containing protein [Reichenbachiella ulvae]MCV9387639.1 AraC family transcriptional regulator [Reichenbachiella ulvae]
MEEIQYILRESIRPYVNCIMVSESSNQKGHYELPIYADGYPGIMFQQSAKGFYLQPRDKKLSELFLYGQTLEPITLESEGEYQFVVLQLYPFASKYLLGVDPRELNDDCYDLLQLNNLDAKKYHQKLLSANELSQKIEIISDLVEELIEVHQVPEDDRIQQAIKLVVESEGKVRVKEICDEIYLTERTLERNFQQQIGLSPKQFAKIIQFQTSLNKLNQTEYDNLTHVGLDSGFTDQSHFIRVFKHYTGQTPSFYLKNTALAQ